MIRILHTADWQIGLKASHVARVGEAVRRARFDAARAIVAQANLDRSDALVLAGDIFEDNHVDNQLVKAVVRILADSTVPVYVLPGNHDPLSQDSVYRRSSWIERPAHVHLLDTRAAVEIAHGKALLLPAPLALKKSAEDPTEALLLPENGAQLVLIGVAHGSLKIEGKYGKDDFPIALDVAARKGLGYLALGHWHGRYVHAGRIAYSGTLETTKFGEDNSGLALRVSIAEGGRELPIIEEFRSGQLQWLTRELKLIPGQMQSIQDFRREIESANVDPLKTLLRLRVSGQSDSEHHLKIKELEQDLSSRYLYCEVDRRDLPTHVVQGRMAELVVKNPFIGVLFDSLANGADDPDLKAATEVERTAARQMLTELLLGQNG